MGESVRTGQRSGQNERLRQANAGRWFSVVIQAARDLWASNVLEWAASLAFYALLSLFPLLISGMVVASFVVDPTWATQRATNLLTQYLPGGQIELEAIVTGAVDQRQRVGILSLIIFLITGRRFLGVLTNGLNHFSDVGDREDSFRRRAGVELALALGLLALGLLALATRPLLDIAEETMQVVPGPDDTLLQIVAVVVRAVILLAIFVLVYAFVPRGDRLWTAVLIGAGAATAFFLLAQGVFALVIDRTWANLSLLYGPLAIAALFLTWAWYVAFITLAGGALASHIKVMILEGSSAQQAGRDHVDRTSS